MNGTIRPSRTIEPRPGLEVLLRCRADEDRIEERIAFHAERVAREEPLFHEDDRLPIKRVILMLTCARCGRKHCSCHEYLCPSCRRLKYEHAKRPPDQS